MLNELLVILFQFFRFFRTLKLSPKAVIAHRRDSVEYKRKIRSYTKAIAISTTAIHI